MLTYNREAKEVQLAVDRSYKKGEPIKAWCGPQVRKISVLGLGSAKVIHLVICGALTSTPLCLQPNRRLLLNYGIVTDDNPHDKCAYSDRAPLNPFCCPCRSALSLPGPAEFLPSNPLFKSGFRV